MCLGVPGQIVELKGGSPPVGVVSFASVAREVCLVYVPEAKVGDYVIVHVGFAISLVDAEEAERTLGVLAELEVLAPETPSSESSGVYRNLP